MKRKYPDAYPWENETQYWIRKEEEADQDRKVQGSSDPSAWFYLIGFLLSFTKWMAAFGIFIYAGFLLSQKLLGAEATGLKLGLFTLLFTYLIFCVIYFLKGTLIGLREKNRKLWILPWLICILLCCMVPAYMLKGLFIAFLNPAQRENSLTPIFGWGIFVISFLYIYGLYQFRKPGVPKIFHWSYNLGLKIIRKISLDYF